MLTGENESSLRKLTEEEELSLDEIRTGNTDYVVKSLTHCSDSLIVQESALSALFKWAEKSSVADKISVLESHSQLFKTILSSIARFPKSSIIQFYGLAVFTSFTKLMESKALFSEELVEKLVASVKTQPSELSDQNKIYYIANCITSLANICTCKYETSDTVEIDKCQKMVVNAGAMEEVLSKLKTSFEHDLIRKCALSFLLKCVYYNEDAKEKFCTLNAPSQILEIISSSDDTMTQWMSIDILHHYVKSTKPDYAKSLLEKSNILDTIFGLLHHDETIQTASLYTSIVYLTHVLLDHLNDSQIEVLSETENLHIICEAYFMYKKHIPEDDQKPYLANRILDILTVISKKFENTKPTMCSQEHIRLYTSIIVNYKGDQGILKKLSDLLELISMHEQSLSIMKSSTLKHSIVTEGVSSHFNSIIKAL